MCICACMRHRERNSGKERERESVIHIIIIIRYLKEDIYNEKCYIGRIFVKICWLG